MGQQFQDADFPALSGARVVRIAVHPELGRAGYGSRALELLRRYYEVSRSWALPLPKKRTWAGNCVLTCAKTSGSEQICVDFHTASVVSVDSLPV